MQLAVRFVRRTVNHNQYLGTGRTAGSGGRAAPNILTDIDSDTNTVERKYRRLLARRKVTLLVEDAVVWQQVLVIMRENLTVPEHHAGIKNVIVLVVRKPDQHGNLAN